MTTRGRRTALWLACLALLSVLAWSVLVPKVGFAPSVRRDPPFLLWRKAHAAEVSRYLDFLRSQEVGEVLPAEQLLRQGRRWRACGGNEFGVPPRELWAKAVPTLKLLKELRSQNLLPEAQVVSGFRGPAYNHCEGGSSGSRHLSNQAFDLDLAEAGPDRSRALCEAWRRMGPGRNWGLGFYSATRVHLDTAGFRTWGYDFHSPSSLCN